MTQSRKQEEPLPQEAKRSDFTGVILVGGIAAGVLGFGVAVQAEMNGRDSLPSIVLGACGAMLVIAAIAGKAWRRSRSQRGALIREVAINYKHFTQYGHSLRTAESLEQRNQDSKVPVADRRQQLEAQWDKTRPNAKND